MGKKAKHPEHENLERWVVSYADFMTLLFAVFTAMYAMANSELMKMEDVAAAISQGFNEQSLFNGVKSVFNGKSAPNDNPNPLSKEQGLGDGVIGYFKSMTPNKAEQQEIEEATEELAETIKKQNNEDENKKYAPDLGEEEGNDKHTRGTELSLQSRGIKVSFDSRLLFRPGTAALAPQSKERVAEIAKRLKKFAGRNLIQVEGHTDSQPIRTVQFPSNWELSTARASSVVRELLKTGDFNAKYLSAAGFGDSRPIADNKTAEGRAKNRRIDIIIYSHQMTQENDPSKQYKKEKSVIRAKESNSAKQKMPDLGKQLLEVKTSESPDQGVKVIFVKRDKDGNPVETNVMDPVHESSNVITPKSDGNPTDLIDSHSAKAETLKTENEHVIKAHDAGHH